MREYEIRSMNTDDFETVMALERDIFGEADGEGLLCPHYVRLCTDFYNQSCFLALHEGQAVGYLLSFVREREAYCTTLAVRERYRRSRALPMLIRAFVKGIAHRVDACRFTVKPENKEARAMHAALGATEIEVRHDYYEPGDTRIVSRIDQKAFEALRDRYVRMGLIDARPDLQVVG